MLKVPYVSYECRIVGKGRALRGPVGEVDEGEEVGQHAEDEPEDHDRVTASLDGQVAEDAEESAAEHLTDGDEHPGYGGEGVRVGAKGGGEADTGAVDGRPNVELDPCVKERYAEQQHVLGAQAYTSVFRASQSQNNQSCLEWSFLLHQRVANQCTSKYVYIFF